MSNMIFIFTPTKLKTKIFFVRLRINKKFTFYCDKLSIETKKSEYTHDHNLYFFKFKKKNLIKSYKYENRYIKYDYTPF